MKKIITISKKKKFIKIFSIVLLLSLAIGIPVGAHLSKRGKKINISKVKQGNVSEYYSTKGIINSSGRNSYIILEGTKVKKVNVEIGESVKEGELLATFDTSGVDKIIKEKEQVYDEAVNQYYRIARTVETASTQVESLGNKIKKLEGVSENLKDQMGVAINSNNTNQISAKDVKSALDVLSGGNSELSDQEVDELIKDMEENDSKIVSSYGLSDINEILSSGSVLENQLLNLDLQIDLLKSQKNTLETSISQTYLEGYKTAVDTSKTILDKMKSQKNALDNGWRANTNGVVLEVNIEEGQVFKKKDTKNINKENLIDILKKLYDSDSNIDDIAKEVASSQNTSSDVGMVINNFNDYYVEFNIGKYDTQRIKLGMDARISFLSKKYKGTVNFIGTKAEDNITGISALTGSKSSSSNKLPAKVSLEKPDNNLILGFDVTVKIKTKEAKNVLTVPIEALMGDSKNSYVYVYNNKDNSVKKRIIEVGLSSDNCYEVKKGLEKGEKVVVNLTDELDKNEKFYVGD